MISAVTTKPVSVIIIDDNAMHRFIVKRTIEKILNKNNYPYSIEEAIDGEKGWNICKEHIFDFYVIDYMMPKMNGVELCRKVLETTSEATVVLYSDTELDGIKKNAGLSIDQAIYFVPKKIQMLADLFKDHLNRKFNLEQTFAKKAEQS